MSYACCLQMHTLRLLERLLAIDYSALSLLRELDLWSVMYSTAFFGFAESQARCSICRLYPPVCTTMCSRNAPSLRSLCSTLLGIRAAVHSPCMPLSAYHLQYLG